MPRPRTYPDDLRDRLVAATLERLRVHAPEDVSLRDLAAECGTSTNAIYSIFGGKDELVASVVPLGLRELTDAAIDLDCAEPGIAALAAAGHRVRAWARSQPTLYRLLFNGFNTPGAPSRVSDADFSRVAAMLECLMDEGIVRPDDPSALAFTLFVCLHGFILLELDQWPDGGPEADRYFAAMQSHLAAGVATDGVLEAVAAAGGAARVTPAPTS